MTLSTYGASAIVELMVSFLHVLLACVKEWGEIAVSFLAMVLPLSYLHVELMFSKTPSTKSLKRSSLVFVGAQVGWKSAIQNATGYDYEFPRFCYEKFDKPIWHDAREANCYR